MNFKIFCPLCHLRFLSFQLPRKKQYNFGLKEIKVIIQLAGTILLELQEAQASEKADMGKYGQIKKKKHIDLFSYKSGCTATEGYYLRIRDW